MWRNLCRSGHLLAFVGVTAVSASTASGEAVAATSLHVACMSTTQVEAARLSDICADFLDFLQTQPGYDVLSSDGSGVAAGPGLEIDVIRATETQLELVPTWIDDSGNRTPLPSAGIVVADTAMTQTMRRDLFLRVLTNPPK
jgi:hypothetical protein